MFGDRRKMNSSFYLILVCLLIAAAGKVITKVEQVTVVFGRQNFPFLKPSYKKALDSLTVSFDKSALLVAVSGPSGSGKSTLAQFVSRNTRAYSTSGNLEMISAIDPIIRRLLGILSIPDDISINSLAESKRKLVEVLLCMEANAVFVDDGCTTKPFLVILDEYCDKDVTAVTSVFLRGLKTLCSALGDGSPGQIFVITHSKKVASMCDNLVVLKDGRLWSQGSPSRVLQNLPSNMIVLD